MTRARHLDVRAYRVFDNEISARTVTGADGATSLVPEHLEARYWTSRLLAG